MGFYLAYQRLDYVPEPIVCLRNAIITIIENLCKRVGGGGKVHYVQLEQEL